MAKAQTEVFEARGRKAYLTGEAARKLGITKTAVLSLIKNGLPAIAMGNGEYLIPKNELTKFLSAESHRHSAELTVPRARGRRK